MVDMISESLNVLGRMNDKVQEQRNGAYIETFTGKKFHLFGAIADSDIVWIDIAHALSMQCRYNGHCNRFYSVAEHSVIMSHILPKKFALYALLHDGSEAYLSDIPSPFKPFLSNYKELETKVQTRIYEVAGLVPMEPQEVREVDRAMLLLEAEHLLPSRGRDWTNYAELKAHYDKWMSSRSWMIWGWTPERAREKWLKRFYQLMEERNHVDTGPMFTFPAMPRGPREAFYIPVDGVKPQPQDIENLLQSAPVSDEVVPMMDDDIPMDDIGIEIKIEPSAELPTFLVDEVTMDEPHPDLTDEQIAELDADPTNSIDAFLSGVAQKKAGK